ncbi:MAG: hypothetical protein OXU42_14625 [Deltaproteobacteria bacterium]|nr:hypothetical protein [Deltaproteobacteria bacterium]
MNYERKKGNTNDDTKAKTRTGTLRNPRSINGILDKDEKTDADRDELKKLTTRAANLEGELRAAIVAEPDATGIETRSDPESRELDGLITRASVGEIFDAVISQGQTDGATRELQQHFGLSGNRVPLALIQRAYTPAPSDVGANQSPIIPAVFPNSAAAWCGVDMPTVGVGEAVYPVLTNDDAAGDVDAGASVTETTGSFTSDVLKPRRIQASFFYRREDAALFAGMDSALRMNLSDALSSGLDKYIVAKMAAGLTDFGNDPTAGSTETFGSYRKTIFDAVDGVYAMDASGVKLLVGPKTYGHMSGLYRGNNADDSALDSVMRISGGVRVSAHVPDPASNVQQAVIARGLEHRHAVSPIWDGIEIIYDNVTKASTGEIVLTAVMLMNFKVIRADGYVRHAFKLA